MSNKLIINRIPSSKTEQKEMANAFISKVIDGDINPIDAVVQMKSISETINTFLKDENIKDAVIQECEKYGKGESPGYLGAVIQIKETGVTYDFSVCNDPVYERLVEESKTNPGAREAQRTLAWEVTSLVHGEEATRQAIEAAGALFGRGGDLAGVDEATLEVALDGVKIDGEFAKAAVGDRVAEAGMKAGLFKSISEARKTIKAGGVYLNNARVEDEEQVLNENNFLHGRFALIRRGKKVLGVVENA